MIESIRYTHETYKKIGIGIGEVRIKDYGPTQNMPGIPGMEFRSDEFYKQNVPEVALITFVHEANHDIGRYGFQPLDHSTNPMSDSEMAKLTRSMQKYIDWVETYVDPFTGQTLLDYIMKHQGKP